MINPLRTKGKSRDRGTPLGDYMKSFRMILTSNQKPSTAVDELHRQYFLSAVLAVDYRHHDSVVIREL